MIHSLDEKNPLRCLRVRTWVSIYHQMSLIFFNFHSFVQPLCLFYFQVLSVLFLGVVILCALVLRLVSLTSAARLQLRGFPPPCFFFI